MSAEPCIHCHKTTDRSAMAVDGSVNSAATVVSFCSKCRQPVCGRCYWEKHPCAK